MNALCMFPDISILTLLWQDSLSSRKCGNGAILTITISFRLELLSLFQNRNSFWGYLEIVLPNTEISLKLNFPIQIPYCFSPLPLILKINRNIFANIVCKVSDTLQILYSLVEPAARATAKASAASSGRGISFRFNRVLTIFWTWAFSALP